MRYVKIMGISFYGVHDIGVGGKVILMDEDISMRIITLKDLWDIFIRCWWIMVLAAVIVAGGFMAYSHITFVPQYESTATLYILRENDEETVKRSSDDFSLALKVVKDCNYLLKSHSVLDEVIAQQNLSISYENLYSNVSTSNPSDTRILEVTVKSDTPQSAKQIVDAICIVGTVKIEEAMGFQQVNLYEYGIIETSPCNRTNPTNYLVLAVLVAILVYAGFFLAFLLDDRIRTEEDIERYLGLSILGDIPNAEDSKGRKSSYYKYKGYRANAGGKE